MFRFSDARCNVIKVRKRISSAGFVNTIFEIIWAVEIYNCLAHICKSHSTSIRYGGNSQCYELVLGSRRETQLGWGKRSNTLATEEDCQTLSLLRAVCPFPAVDWNVPGALSRSPETWWSPHSLAAVWARPILLPSNPVGNAPVPSPPSQPTACHPSKGGGQKGVREEVVLAAFFTVD